MVAAPRRRHARTLVLACLVALLLLVPAASRNAPGVAAAPNPFAGSPWYDDPDNPIKGQAEAWRQSRPGDAALLDTVAHEQYADWFGSWFGNATTTDFANRRVTQIAATGAVPIIVAYNIPNLNCSMGNGSANAATYAAWVDALARGIGNRKVAILVEPDGLTVTECLSVAQRNERFAMVHAAVRRFKQNPLATVYIDGGDDVRNTPDEIVAILQAAGVGDADGFSLNVTVYQFATAEVAYGHDVATRLGGKHFVVDTSRDGHGQPGGVWCNARTAAIGLRPTANTGDPLADAFLWVKPIWQSDNTCDRGDPAAGANFFDYTLLLVRNSLAMFTDLPADPTYARQINDLARLGVVRGNGDGTVGTDAQVLRAQMAALIARPFALEFEDDGTPFADRGAIDPALWRNVGALAQHGIARGYGDGTFNPTGPVLEVQVISFIARGMVARGTWQPATADNPALYPDVPASSGARLDLLTYRANTGAIPSRPENGGWGSWARPATRGWFVQAEWQALDPLYHFR